MRMLTFRSKYKLIFQSTAAKSFHCNQFYWYHYSILFHRLHFVEFLFVLSMNEFHPVKFRLHLNNKSQPEWRSFVFPRVDNWKWEEQFESSTSIDFDRGDGSANIMSPIQHSAIKRHFPHSFNPFNFIYGPLKRYQTEI